MAGEVDELLVLDDRIWINCVDMPPFVFEDCAVYVDSSNKRSREIKQRDGIWWQPGNSCWTKIYSAEAS